MGAPHKLELGEALSIGAIPGALLARREAIARGCGDTSGLRVCTLNLAAFSGSEAAQAEAMEVLCAMVAEHPGRFFAVRADRGAQDALIQARVAVDETPHAPGVPPSYSELIALEAHGPALEHLPATLISLLEPDQPACAWWVTPPGFGPLWEQAAQNADRMIVDTSVLDPWDLMRLVAYLERENADPTRNDFAALGDLTWARLKPFQALCARFFDGPTVREKLATLDRIEISHVSPRDGATAIGAAMLGAWVRNRLLLAAQKARIKLAPQVVLKAVTRADLGPGEIAELVLHGSGSPPLELAVTRQADAPQSIHAESRSGAPGIGNQRLRYKAGSKAWLLSQVLQVFGRDPLYEQVLMGAVDILRDARR